jgi:glycerophosphoryl diester phosphodiesterase
VPTGGGGFGIMAYAGKERKQAAWAFIEYCAEPASAAYRSLQTGYLPVVPAAARCSPMSPVGCAGARTTYGRPWTNMSDRIRIIGHRGAVGLEPENTLRSFRRAQEVGADEVELDIRLSADGHLVVVHDATVDRTTDGTGTVAELTLARLQALDAGAGERIPTYAEVLDAIDISVQTEIKAIEAVPAFAALVRERGLTDRVYAASHHAEILDAVREAVPEVARALILPSSPADAVDQAHAVEAAWLALGIRNLTADLVGAAHEAGIAIDAWPVPDPETLDRARAFGVAAVTTDNPHLLG